jgi:hypothetical protein
METYLMSPIFDGDFTRILGTERRRGIVLLEWDDEMGKLAGDETA